MSARPQPFHDSAAIELTEPHAPIELAPPILLQSFDPMTSESRPGPGDPNRVAVLVCHGMGQQVKFQTLMDVARAFVRAPGVRVGSITARIVRVRKQGENCDLHRAEFVLERDGKERRTVHLYEAYWAPLTEGKVGIHDVLSFLTSGAINGFLHAGKSAFWRWMFGREIPLPISATKTRARVGLALGVVLGLVATNFLIGVIGGSRLLHGGGSSWPSDRIVVLIAKELSILVLLLVVAGSSVFVLQKRRAGRGPQENPGAVVGPTWAAIYLALIGTIVLPLTMVVQLAWPMPDSPFARPLPNWAWLLMTALWLLLLGASAVVKHFLIEYVGDVAAYVSAHTVSKFHDIREAIQKVSYQVGDSMYAALQSDGQAFEYGRVVVVGHSLGSIIAYDTLNAILREDQVCGGRVRAVDRTRMLLTFGSPLNKTAFIYRTQMPEGAELREALAATVQPLIQNYDLRPREWVNLHSKADWIGGPLQYYDDPDDQRPEHRGKKIRNLEDPEATIPLAAHTEFWENQLLGAQLVEGVFS